MQRKIITTADGSTTIYLPEWEEHYHSKHGAIQEAQHVFIRTGLHYFAEAHETKELSVLEIGFGTGLNAFLTLLEAERGGLNISYTGIEAYPVAAEELDLLNYSDSFSEGGARELFQDLHRAEWGEPTKITSSFNLLKREEFFSEIEDQEAYDLIYFDAFGPRVQPDLWSESIFEKMFGALKAPGCLVTYSAKGSVRRAMQAVGLEVERLPGPPGKREMLRATKNSRESGAGEEQDS